MKAVKVSFATERGDFCTPHKGQGMFASGANHVTGGLEPPVPVPDLWGGERSWRLSSITNGQRLNQSHLRDETSSGSFGGGDP